MHKGPYQCICTASLLKEKTHKTKPEKKNRKKESSNQLIFPVKPSLQKAWGQAGFSISQKVMLLCCCQDRMVQKRREMAHQFTPKGYSGTGAGRRWWWPVQYSSKETEEANTRKNSLIFGMIQPQNGHANQSHTDQNRSGNYDARESTSRIMDTYHLGEKYIF